ncbi:hypothetical protein INT45_010809 [Circinella minor]|uniref:NADH dehydrogenase [ubiquinone] iron-sulfur protein 5 n=1 Tax=Circinella minor TaxID=1195481 RepID=A0A8H7RVH3_9FUNG|nr:hypothetical protein INT45_010809 [Circinella minor]KAI7852330.1 hypothetical protein BDC45DRAFT_514028 [Circinella umbellata]
MASGFGLNGGRGRCFHFWQEFNKCYAGADFPQQCNAQRDDYMECLHHTKEFARVAHIKAEELKQAEKKAHLKNAANAAATSNLPRLNIVDNKEVEAKA